MTYTWKCKIRLTNGALQEVTVQADNFLNAKNMIEATYGKGSIVGSPVRVF